MKFVNIMTLKQGGMLKKIFRFSRKRCCIYLWHIFSNNFKSLYVFNSILLTNSVDNCVLCCV